MTMKSTKKGNHDQYESIHQVMRKSLYGETASNCGAINNQTSFGKHLTKIGIAHKGREYTL
ncbi:hypothetical protein BCT90_23335 [Vibrio lentus]|uniref:Uncharacterized protein n=1 Tax=Vibrio lentus TaxID=136468 RepID=A0A1B9PVH0_9VIBR|nr:hypothetical protein A6E08_23210 [Vibrio lentus]PME54979.1 hypothetical protein BCV34_21335 [Vibrio lentus]PME56693.1 hypothetical protein BCV30_18735 [Vibrio lentus]PME80791.1 hypothetical protein BCV27_15145 [Vibrio lentus]PMG80066.1 hypothetical protein BCU86_19850 [Vibrio lentus]